MASRRSHDFDVMATCDWVNVIALTPEKQVLLVRQFRHGTREITLEIPGGAVDKGETPLQAAKRELWEETGYQADSWEELGLVEPNPAIQGNRTYTFLARSAMKTGKGQPDENEEIEVEQCPLSELTQLVHSRRIKHALVICAFFHLFQRE